MRILLLGANGQLGSELAIGLSELGEVMACRRKDVDLTDSTSIITAIDEFNPDVIVNAAAYTAVDKAEVEYDLAFKINADAVAVLAYEASARNIWLIHYSTDYVFDGTKVGRYSESDTTNPLNVYGLSKLAGEQVIVTSRCKYLIFRTSWVVGVGGHNFVKSILHLAIERDSLSVINDQYGVPTPTTLISRVTSLAIKSIAMEENWPSGLYHLAPKGKTTWHDIAQTVIQLSKDKGVPLTIEKNALHTVTTDEYPTAARRPANSLLDTSKIESLLNIDLPDWKDDFPNLVDEIIKELELV